MAAGQGSTRSAALAFAVAAALLAATPALAVEQTGELNGVARDETNQPLPGVTVVATSPALQGQRAVTTDARGRFALLNLPPGRYELRFSAPERVDRVLRDIPVNIGRARDLDVVVAPQAVTGTEEVVVTGRVPFVDERRTNTQETFSRDYLENATVSSAGRDYLDIAANTASSVETNDGDPAIRGATRGENVYLIDGVDSTDPVTATFGTNFIYDAIEEVQVQTGGYSAEFGRATGGVINAVTKSGGNDFSGTLDVRFRNDSMSEDPEKFVQGTEGQQLDLSQTIGELTFGGPVMRDKLWFFLAGAYNDVSQTPSGSLSTTDFNGTYYLGKLTWQPSVNHRLVGQVTGDPADIDNIDASVLVQPEATSFQTQGSRFLTARYLGVLGPRTTLEGQAAHYKSYLDGYPQRNDFTTPGFNNLDTGELSQNALNAQYTDRYRYEGNVALTWSPGDHRIKGGIDYQDVKFDATSFTPGGEYYDTILEAPGVETPLIINVDIPAGLTSNEGQIFGYFLQDEWRVLDQLTLNLGVRYDTYSYDDDLGREVFSSDLLQPRLGAAWDISGKGRDILKANYSVLGHTALLAVPSIVNSRAQGTDIFINENVAFWLVDGTPGPLDFDGDGVISDRAFFGTFGGPGGSVIARNGELDATQVKEWSVSYERALTPNTGLVLTYVDRDTDDIIEDYFDENAGVYVVDNFPGLDRQYQAVEVKFRTDWRRLHLNTSYTWSEAEGNIEYTQSLGSDFDFPEHRVNRYGWLSTDVRHAFKAQGYVELPWIMQLGFNAIYLTGFPYDRFIPAEEATYGFEYIEPRGSRRLPDLYQIDMDLRKKFRVRDVDFSLIASVINLLGSERVVEVQEQDQIAPGGIQWGEPTDFQNPRRYEVGARVTF